MGRKVEPYCSVLGRKERAGGRRSAGVQRSPGGARPPKGTDKGAASPDPCAAWSRGLSTKLEAGGAEPAPRAGAHGTVDPHDCERRFLRLIPTSMKTAPAGPPAGPLSRPLAGQLQPGSLPPFVSPPPRPSPPSPTQLPGWPQASQVSRLGHLGRTKRGSAPNLGEGED